MVNCEAKLYKFYFIVTPTLKNLVPKITIDLIVKNWINLFNWR
jgi:hypothetical protein